MKPTILVDPFPRTMELIFSKDKLNYLKSNYKLIKRIKHTEEDFYNKNISEAKFIIGQPTLKLSTLKKANVTVNILKTPMFLTSREDFSKHLKLPINFICSFFDQYIFLHE